MKALMTAATCGDMCWQAREDVCRCSCGGANHGCLRTADGVQPARTAKLEGERYTLKAVGDIKELHDEAYAMNKAAGITYVYAYSSRDMGGVPAKLRLATKDQVAKWPELASYRGDPSKHWLDN